MKEVDPIQELAERLSARCKKLSNARLEKVEHLVGDMSTRRYMRLHFSGQPTSAILMLLNHAPGPVRGGRNDITQDDTFVELSHFLPKHAIRVPQLYLDARTEGALIVEDIGDCALWRFALNELRKQDEQIAANWSLNEDPVTALFKKAIDIIIKLQAIPPDSACVAFQRWAEPEWYRQTIAEFSQYYAEPRGMKASQRAVLDRAYDAICECIAAHPQTLSHFDYMAFNLFVLPSSEICMIDFQDMSLNSPVRDIISLINDRDMDSALGKSRHAELLKYFVDLAQLGPKFAEWYDEYLMQWDFRVSGRFLQLADKRGVERYRQWVPGTLRRLGRTLVRCYRRYHGFDDLIDILVNFCPEIKEGTQDPWPL
ncbi:MAG: phosphotransferase [Oligoflexia bacterium]|nr:phosphotransferase [Oligoflexia bacterium]